MPLWGGRSRRIISQTGSYCTLFDRRRLERRPCWFLQFPLARHQALLYPAIGTDQGQHAAPAVAARIDDLRAVRRITWANVKMTLGEYLDIAAPAKIHGRYAVAAVFLGDERQLRLIRRQPWPRVVAALKREAPRLVAALSADPVDLRAARAIRREIQALAVLRPLRLGVDPRIVGDPGQRLSGQIQYIDIQIAVARRERERELLAVRRPRRRHQRLIRLHHDVRILAVRIRHDEPVILVRQRPQHGNIGDASGECAAYT